MTKIVIAQKYKFNIYALLKLMFSDSFFKNLKSLENQSYMCVCVFETTSIWELKKFMMKSRERLL